MTGERTNSKQRKARHFVREWRKFRGYTQEKLAEMVGVTHSALGQLERGDVNYTQPMLEALANALHCTPGELLERDPLDSSSAWVALDSLSKAPPDKARQAIEMIGILLKAS